MKLLYLSCHEILEFDEVRLFHELGHNVFSPGAYVEPRNRGDNHLRPDIPDPTYDPEDVEAWHALGRPGVDNKELLTREFVDRFDVVIVMHIPDWVAKNWEAMGHKPVVWRTIGQSVSSVEQRLLPYRRQGLRIVRYSPRERTIPGYIGEDALIRFYKDQDEFGGYVGEKQQVITFAQSMKQRDQACNFTLFESVTRDLPRTLYGPGNEEVDFSGGKLSFEEMKEALQGNRVYFAAGTTPASYTLNFVEAWMTAIPVVAIGPQYGNASHFPDHNLYEVPDFIRSGVNGYCSDDHKQLRQWCIDLLQDHNLARQIGEEGRKSAIEIFNKRRIKEEWKLFLKSL